MRARSHAARGQGVGVEPGNDGALQRSDDLVVERTRPVSRSIAAALGRVNRHIAYKDLLCLAEAMGTEERGLVMPVIAQECQLASWSVALGCPDVARNALSRLVTLIEFVHAPAADGARSARRSRRSSARRPAKRAR